MVSLMGENVVSKRTQTSSFGTTKREGHDASRFYRRKIYRDAKPVKNGVGVENKDGELKDSELNVIYFHDSRSMSQLPDSCVHLMVTSPPYNVGKDCEKGLRLDGYKDFLRAVLQETHRVLVDGGRACINITNIEHKPYIPLNAHIIKLAHECGFLMRGEIIWAKKERDLKKERDSRARRATGSKQTAGSKQKIPQRLHYVHDYILVFSKGLYQRHPIRENTIGRDDFMEATKSVWHFPAASIRREKKLPSFFPLELPLRLIHLYSYKDEVILDPFMGVGTTAKAAVKTGRHFIGYELKKEYVAIAQNKGYTISFGTPKREGHDAP